LAVVTPIVLFDLDNTLVHSRIDFLGIRQAIIGRLLDVGALDAPPADPRVRAIPEWLDLAAEFDPALATELWTIVDQFERDGMVHGTVEADARATLDHLQAAGLKLAVLTNNSLGSADAALDRFDLRAPLDLVLARDVVPRSSRAEPASPRHTPRSAAAACSWSATRGSTVRPPARGRRRVVHRVSRQPGRPGSPRHRDLVQRHGAGEIPALLPR